MSRLYKSSNKSGPISYVLSREKCDTFVHLKMLLHLFYTNRTCQHETKNVFLKDGSSFLKSVTGNAIKIPPNTARTSLIFETKNFKISTTQKMLKQI